MVQTSKNNASNPNDFIRSLGVSSIEHDSGKRLEELL